MNVLPLECGPTCRVCAVLKMAGMCIDAAVKLTLVGPAAAVI